jgi:hypothetical protein
MPAKHRNPAKRCGDVHDMAARRFRVWGEKHVQSSRGPLRSVLFNRIISVGQQYPLDQEKGPVKPGRVLGILDLLSVLNVIRDMFCQIGSSSRYEMADTSILFNHF